MLCRESIFVCVSCDVVDSISPPRPIHEAKLLTLNTGLVVWASHVYYLASCPVAMSAFPSSFVDPPSASRSRTTTGAGEADCELRFGSWTLDSDSPIGPWIRITDPAGLLSDTIISIVSDFGPWTRISFAALVYFVDSYKSGC